MTCSALMLLAAAAAAASIVESYTPPDLHERLAHGRQLKIYLPKSAERLEFRPANDPSNTVLYWDRGKSRTIKGRVSGTGSDRRWYIDKVTYEDQGAYIQRDYWRNEISTVNVAVTPRRNYVKCLAGETLYISLEGINPADAVLTFSGETANVTLVRDGDRVSQDLPDYWDRVRTSTLNIEIKNVNYSDEGHYTLRDRRNRVVSVTRMDLTNYKEHSGGNPLMALLLLLGIPAGICCCCRKKIFKQKANTAATLQASPDVSPQPAPVGPCPPYSAPGHPGVAYYQGPSPTAGPVVHPPPPGTDPGQWNGPPPSPGFSPAYPPQNPAYPPQNPAYPPQNPAYPPAGPAAIPPTQPPQWAGPPPGQYPPGPTAPMGYVPAPVMYSTPGTEEIKMENMASSPADPLLSTGPQAAPATVPPSSTSALNTPNGACQFQIDGGKNTTNFL